MHHNHGNEKDAYSMHHCGTTEGRKVSDKLTSTINSIPSRYGYGKWCQRLLQTTVSIHWPILS